MMENSVNRYSLAMNLFNDLCGRTKENFVYSPLSIGTAIAILCAGTDGETKAELLRLLGHPDSESLHEFYGKLIANKELPFRIANRCLAREGSNPDKKLAESIMKIYEAAVESADFGTDGRKLESEINEWVSVRTEGMIRDLLPSGSLTSSVILLIVNAVYFKGTWVNEFDTMDDELPFKQRDGVVKMTRFMKIRSKSIKYFETEKLRFAKIPYKEADCYMVVAIPREDSDFIDEVLSAVGAAEMDEAITALNNRSNPKVILRMPKFKIEYSHSALIQAMKKLGVTKIFSAGEGDFSKLFPEVAGLFVSDVIHKAVIEVDEKGTTAAAATAVLMMRCSMAVQPDIRMDLDRPFYFAIHEGSSHSATFQGICHKLE